MIDIYKIIKIIYWFYRLYIFNIKIAHYINNGISTFKLLSIKIYFIFIKKFYFSLNFSIKIILIALKKLNLIKIW